MDWKKTGPGENSSGLSPAMLFGSWFSIPELSIVRTQLRHATAGLSNVIAAYLKTVIFQLPFVVMWTTKL